MRVISLLEQPQTVQLRGGGDIMGVPVVFSFIQDYNLLGLSVTIWQNTQHLNHNQPPSLFIPFWLGRASEEAVVYLL